MCKQLSTLYLHHIWLYPTGQRHTYKPELLWKGVDTGRGDSLRPITVTTYDSCSLMGPLLLLPILLILEACYSLTKFLPICSISYLFKS